MIDGFRDTPQGRVHTLEWHDAGPGAPWLHFAHATGMCALLYAEALAPLAGRFNIVASDARGHGTTELRADPATLTSWSTYVDDLGDLLASIHPGSWWLAGHSMGATVSADLAARPAINVAGLALIEPAFVPFAAAASWEPVGPQPMADQAARRRARWPSREAIRAAYHGRGVFARWSDAALDAYLAGGTRDAGGEIELACAPAWEAATFRAVSTTLQPALAGWTRPLALFYGTVGSTVGEADAAAIHAAAPQATVRRYDGAGHFLPIEQPGVLGEAVIALAAGSATLAFAKSC